MIVAIIQARMDSTRLPGKVMREICGHPMIWHQIQRVKRSRLIGKIVLATTTNEKDAPLLALAEECGVEGFAGSEDDVLDRLYRAAKQHRADVVVRLTGDCPLIDPQVTDRVIETFLKRRDSVDWIDAGRKVPEGLDTEAFSFAALERAWREAQKEYEREHATVYIALSGRFRTDHLDQPWDLSGMRWTVDEEADFQFVTKVYEELYPIHNHEFGVENILDLLRRRPELLAINQDITRNEGFLRSLRKERRGKEVKVRSLERSEEYWRRAEKLIPAGTQTLSKGPTQFVKGVAPKYLQRGQGSHVWDVDGNEYIDYPMALGPIILGHNYPAVVEAIKKQLEQGISFTLMHPLEVELAELLAEVIPCAEMVRYGKNGSDATGGAVRAARAYTGREKVAHCGYHGWQDWYIGCTTRNRGVPQSCIDLQFAFEYNDIASLEKIFAENPGEIAAVIMEPIGAILPRDNFLENVRDLAHTNGAVFIFDEVATGFRFSLGGAQEYFNVIPDIACFGKAMGNGMPLSAIVGKREYMQVFDDVFFSFTFGGECLSLAASIATINEMREKNVIAHLWELGRRLQDGYNRLTSDMGMTEYTECIGLAPRTVITFKDKEGKNSLFMKSLFQQEAIKRGILFSGAHCICYSHIVEDIETTLGAYQEALDILAKGIKGDCVADLLEGGPVEPVFRPI